MGRKGLPLPRCGACRQCERRAVGGIPACLNGHHGYVIPEALLLLLQCNCSKTQCWMEDNVCRMRAGGPPSAPSSHASKPALQLADARGNCSKL